ncbi:MAG: ATP-dependent zinc metalloprotease FtsH [Myxococcota bacterium]
MLTESSPDASVIKFSEFREAAAEGDVDTVEIMDLEVNGKFSEQYADKQHDGRRSFKTIGPVGEDLQDVLMAKEVAFTFVKSDDNRLWHQLLLTVVPLLLIVVLLVFVMRQFQGGGGKAMTFGKSKARLLNESNKKVTFNDIAGIEEAKEQLEEIVEFLKNPKKFTRLGGRIPKGVLLMGKPGTGKTLLAKGVAGEAGVPFYSISGSDFVEMFVGVGASRVRDLFEQGKKNAPCIIFIDEIDAVGRQRGAGMGGGHDEREQTLNQLLVEMDGFESTEGVILIAATNRPDVLDPALLRPGRFDRRIVVPPPDVRGREQILQIHTRRTPVAKDVELSQIARGTPGFSGADLENLVNEAALLAARRGKDRVELVDFEDAKDKVMMGAERKSAVITDAEKRVTAYHEAGHALVALLQEGTDPVHKVTIIPRGRALGVTQQLPEEDRHTMRRDYVLSRLSVMMGGRAAEKIVFDEITTGAGNDIQVATDMARKMVCEWGMSDRVGPLNYSDGDNNPFLGDGGMRTHRPYSESVAKEIDAEVKRIVTEQHDLAVDLLREHNDLLELMAQALLEFEALNADEIDLLLEDRDLDRIREKREREEEEAAEREEERAPKKGFSSKLKEKKQKGSFGDLSPSTNS